MAKRIERTEEQKAEHRAIREKSRAEKPSFDEIVAEAGAEPMSQGLFLELLSLMRHLRKEREARGLTLAQVAEKAGLDAPALSRLESGRSPNPTVETVSRVAAALGLRVVCGLESARS